MITTAQWNRFSTNDHKALSTVALECWAKGIRYHMASEHPDYPPTIFAWCERKAFDRIMDLIGVRRK